MRRVSDISEMNAAVQKRTGIWGNLLAVLTLTAAFPHSVLALFSGQLQKELWWGVLAEAVVVLTLVLEALPPGRDTAHRRSVGDTIVGRVIQRVCLNPTCPQLTSPTPSARRSAMGLFYSRIDKASREVAF